MGIMAKLTAPALLFPAFLPFAGLVGVYVGECARVFMACCRACLAQYMHADKWLPQYRGQLACD